MEQVKVLKFSIIARNFKTERLNSHAYVQSFIVHILRSYAKDHKKGH